MVLLFFTVGHREEGYTQVNKRQNLLTHIYQNYLKKEIKFFRCTTEKTGSEKAASLYPLFQSLKFSR
jgi:hypothetical protein